MLSLQCREPGLRAAEPPSCLSSTHFALLPGKAQKKFALCNLVLRVGVLIWHKKGKKVEFLDGEPTFVFYHGVNRAQMAWEPGIADLSSHIPFN